MRGPREEASSASRCTDFVRFRLIPRNQKAAALKCGAALAAFARHRIGLVHRSTFQERPMSNQNSAVRTRVPRLLPLAACLAAILGVSVSHAASGVEPAHARNAHPMSGGGRGPKPTPQSHTVNTCVDDLSQNSLRTLVATAGEGEIIDLAHLPTGAARSRSTARTCRHTSRSVRTSCTSKGPEKTC